MQSISTALRSRGLATAAYARALPNGRFNPQRILQRAAAASMRPRARALELAASVPGVELKT